MSTPLIFVPADTRPTAIVNWLIAVTVGAIPLMLRGSNPDFQLFSACLFLAALAVGVFTYKKPIQISISTQDKTLVYDYINCWGQARSLTVDLTHPRGYYAYESFTRLTGGWHLVLYSSWNFYKRISIKQNDSLGFNKEQLDQIAALVHAHK